ncbi:uncharacterized protein PEZ65_022495 [Lycodopsis pacificus]
MFVPAINWDNQNYQWVQCSTCKNWLHFECAGVEGDWTSKDFFCRCNIVPDVDNILESVKAEEILKDEEIKTEQIIQRLERLLSVLGTVAEKQLFITEVILPEVVIQWLQRTSNMCRYQAESVLLENTYKEKSAPELSTSDRESTEEVNVLLRNSLAAADWCRKTQFDGGFKVPAVLSMDEKEQQEALQELHNCEDDPSEESPAELFTFVFDKQKDYEKFCTELVDKNNFKVFECCN